MAKLIKVSDTKAYRIEAIRMEKGGEKLISIRQMYATKKDPTLKPGYQGMTIPADLSPRVIKAIEALIEADEYKVLPPKEK